MSMESLSYSIFPNGQRVEDILKKAEANYSKAEIDMKMSSKANAVDVYNKTEVDIALRSKVDKVSGKGLSTNDYTTADKEKLAGIETQANKTVVDDTLDNTSTNPVQNKVVKAALDNKADTADIPTVPITAIQKNGTGITPVSGTVNITVPTQASDINAATATQGDKADTAIQGIKVNSSTVNPDANKVVDITVPTTAAEVSALPDTTKYAATLSLTINSSTFVMTGQLKDQNGDNLGTAQTIDLPLESVVVGGSYNSQTKKVVLTLQNGNTIEFSVADLVAGLQTELSESNKLNPAYIAYDSTHRAVSDTEKSTWNGKQNALSSTQLDAVNSGIDSEKVEQIEINKNNISSQQNTTAQGGNGYAIINGIRQYTGDTVAPPVPPNSLWIKDGVKVKTDNYFNTDDFGAIQVDAQGNLRCGTNCGILPQGTYTLSATTSASQNTLFHTIKNGSTYTLVTIDSLPYTFTADGVSEQIIRVANATTTSWAENSYTNIMLNTGSTAESYTPYWTDVIDEKINPLENNILMLETMNGAKNLMHYDSIDDTRTTGTITAMLNSDMTITINGTSGDTPAVIGFVFPLKSGEYWLNGCPTDGSFETYCTDIRNQIYGSIIYGRDTGSGATVNISDDGNYAYNIRIAANTTINNKIFKPMLISSDVKNAGFTNYQPYALSNVELTAKEQQNENNISYNTNMGVKNLLNCSLTELKSDSYNTIQFSWSGNVCTTPRGVTYTINADNTIDVVATSVTTDVWFRLKQNFQYGVDSYVISGCPAGGSTNTYFLESDSLNARDTGSTVVIERSSAYTDSIFLVVKAGTTFTGTFKPMICPKSLYDADPSYQPYAMSNAELTNKEQSSENNILTIANQSTQYNVLNLSAAENVSASSGITYSILSDGSVHIEADISVTGSALYFEKIPITSNIPYITTGCPSGGGNTTYKVQIYDNETNIANADDTGSGSEPFTITTGKIGYRIRFAVGQYNIVVKPMVISKSLYDSGFTNYQPYALPNITITPELIDLVDSGAKNLWDFKNAIYNGKSADASYTKTDTDITVTSNGAWSLVIYRVNGLITGQRYVWSVEISDYNVQSDTCRLRISSDAASQNPIATQNIEGNGNVYVEFVGQSVLYFAYYINFSATSYQNTYKASENMICTKAAWDISQAYQLYRPTYEETVEQVAKNKNDISLVDITNNFTAAEGFTKNTTLSKIYKQGKHVFGKLVLEVNSGTMPTASTSFATTSEKPSIPIVKVGYCGINAFKIGNTAYVFIAANNGEISGYDNETNNADTAINIDIDYVVS